LHPFINSTRGCSVPELAEFYDNDFDELLGVSAEGFDVYVRENKHVFDAEWLLALTQRLPHKRNLIELRSLQKGEITPIGFHELEIPLQ